MPQYKPPNASKISNLFTFLSNFFISPADTGQQCLPGCLSWKSIKKNLIRAFDKASKNLTVVIKNCFHYLTLFFHEVIYILYCILYHLNWILEWDSLYKALCSHKFRHSKWHREMSYSIHQNFDHHTFNKSKKKRRICPNQSYSFT